MRTLYLLTNQNADKIDFWSGIPHFIKKKLETQYKVVQINPGDYWIPAKIFRVFNILRRRLKFRYNFQHSILSGIVYAPIIWYHLFIENRATNGLVLGVAISSETIFIPKQYKIVLFTDATFSLLIDGYNFYRNLLSLSILESKWVDKLSLRRANHIMFTSDWSRNQAIVESGISLSKTSINRFGANLEDRFSNQDVETRLNETTIRFLLPSTDWDRKGGDYVLEFLNRFAKRNNQHVELTIFGIRPDNVGNHEYLKVNALGWLNKSNSLDKNTIITSYKMADFMFLPTKADCTPVAISEAFCYGVPVIASNIGGIPEMLGDKNVGTLWNLENEWKTMRWIEERVKNDVYRQSSIAARQRYDSSYNWDVWLTNFNQVVNLL